MIIAIFLIRTIAIVIIVPQLGDALGGEAAFDEEAVHRPWLQTDVDRLVPKMSPCKRNEICSGPISADPSCPFPRTAPRAADWRSPARRRRAPGGLRAPAASGPR